MIATDALMLPALSSVSTRAEFEPLAAALGELRCRIVDWPGFGAKARGRAALTPAGMLAFVDEVVMGMTPGAIGVAAGHGAVYLADSARRHPGRLSRLVLVAPTWRGPLPTMTKGKRPGFCRGVRRAMEAPVLGQALYRLNLSDMVIGRMLRAHVYADPAHVTAEVLAAKRAVARQDRARFGTAAFVSGGLDPVQCRAAFLEVFAAGLPPVLMLRPEQAPARSGAEMDALGASGRVVSVSVPGALAAHEEYPAAVAAAIRDFLG